MPCGSQNSPPVNRQFSIRPLYTNDSYRKEKIIPLSLSLTSLLLVACYCLRASTRKKLNLQRKLISNEDKRINQRERRDRDRERVESEAYQTSLGGNIKAIDPSCVSISINQPQTTIRTTYTDLSITITHCNEIFPPLNLSAGPTTKKR